MYGLFKDLITVKQWPLGYRTVCFSHKVNMANSNLINAM